MKTVFVLLLLDCSVVFVVVLDCSVVFVALFLEGFVLRLVFLLHEPSGCVQLAFCQKQHGQGFWLLLASFLEHLKWHAQVFLARQVLQEMASSGFASIVYI